MAKKNWKESQTKVGIALLAIAPVLATIGAALTGQIDFMTMLAQLTMEAGAVKLAFGLRDLPILNK